MHSFASDNQAGIHPKILAAIIAANQGHAQGYGQDDLTKLSDCVFKTHFGETAQVCFVFNGTAANVLSLKIYLEDFQAALVSEGSHLFLDECGAPEKSGIKLYPVQSQDGKISIESLKPFLTRKKDQHFSPPGLLSLTQPTELGTLYSIEELKSLIDFAKSHHLFVHLDGARLIHACYRLNCTLKNLTSDIGVDVVSFGGTKNGLLHSEAVVFFDQQKSVRSFYWRKQLLNLPTKTRFMATQFLSFFEKNLWLDIARSSCQMTDLLKSKVADYGPIIYPVESNMIFVQLPKVLIKPLRKQHFFYLWDNQVSRLVTSFDTSFKDIDSFAKILGELCAKQC